MGSFSEFHDFEQAGWEKAAASYERGFGDVTIQSVGPILDAVGAGPGVRLLDVACGPGYVAAAAARRKSSVIGIDFSPSMVALASRRNPGLEFIEGDAESLDFQECSFDAVVMNFGMLHLARPAAAISERTSELLLSHCRPALASLLLLSASQKNTAPVATLFDANPWPLWGATSSPKHVTAIHPPLRDVSPLGATPVDEIPSIGFAVSS